MAEIKTRPATPEFRDGYDRIFGGNKLITSSELMAPAVSDTPLAYRYFRTGQCGEVLFDGDSIICPAHA